MIERLVHLHKFLKGSEKRKVAELIALTAGPSLKVHPLEAAVALGELPASVLDVLVREQEEEAEAEEAENDLFKELLEALQEEIN
jgi:hypothetical protein